MVSPFSAMDAATRQKLLKRIYDIDLPIELCGLQGELGMDREPAGCHFCVTCTGYGQGYGVQYPTRLTGTVIMLKLRLYEKHCAQNFHLNHPPPGIGVLQYQGRSLIDLGTFRDQMVPPGAHLDLAHAGGLLIVVWIGSNHSENFKTIRVRVWPEEKIRAVLARVVWHAAGEGSMSLIKEEWFRHDKGQTIPTGMPLDKDAQVADSTLCEGDVISSPSMWDTFTMNNPDQEWWY